MKEQELRAALRSAMAASTPPPPMSPTAVLDKARRTRARRRAIWAGAGSGLVVATLAVTAAAVPDAPGHSFMTGAGKPPVAPNPNDASAEPLPTGPDGKPQEDRTARAGARYEKGVELLAQLVAAVPAGYTVPDQPGTSDSAPTRYHQAEFDARVDGIEVWSYLATVQVAQGQGAGGMLAEVHTAGNQLPTEPCALTLRLWGMTGDCQVVTVGWAQVGVVVSATGSDRRYDQWAAYRHPDGVVVFVAQAARSTEAGQSLTKLPLTVPQLAALAMDEHMHLN